MDAAEWVEVEEEEEILWGVAEQALVEDYFEGK